VIAALRIVALAASLAAAQAAGPDRDATVAERDAAFWRAYNACDAAAIRQFFTEDVEFYHDRGGATVGLDALDAAIRKNLCGGGARVRRAAVDGSVRVSTLRDGERVYAAIVAGEHTFHVTQPGKPEFLDGQARFTHLWRLQDGVWRMSRVLSYDHGPPAARQPAGAAP
jgi:ketosteroid isomerase-like protein